MNSLVRHYEECFKKHGDNHKGVDWPNQEDAEKRYKVMSEMLKYDNHPYTFIPSFLDYGCGLGHFYEWLNNERLIVGYSGYDLSEIFIKECRKKYPQKYWYTENPPKMDYVVMNGVFTERVGMSDDEAWGVVKAETKKAWELCHRGIAFNLMNTRVDKHRDDLLIVHPGSAAALASQLSEKYIIRQDYLKYEYTVYVYKNS